MKTKPILMAVVLGFALTACNGGGAKETGTGSGTTGPVAKNENPVPAPTDAGQQPAKSVPFDRVKITNFAESILDILYKYDPSTRRASLSLHAYEPGQTGVPSEKCDSKDLNELQKCLKRHALSSIEVMDLNGLRPLPQREDADLPLVNPEASAAEEKEFTLSNPESPGFSAQVLCQNDNCSMASITVSKTGGPLAGIAQVGHYSVSEAQSEFIPAKKGAQITLPIYDKIFQMMMTPDFVTSYSVDGIDGGKTFFHISYRNASKATHLTGHLGDGPDFHIFYTEGGTQTSVLGGVAEFDGATSRLSVTGVTMAPGMGFIVGPRAR